MEYAVAAAAKGRFMGWPANNGLWSWDEGREILVGYTNGPFVEQRGHNIGTPQLSRLTRSLDGGRTWTTESPENYVGQSGEPVPSPGGIQFDHPDFVLRVAADGYHGTNDPKGNFFYSLDRGKTWLGPYRFNGLHETEELDGLEITARTNYIVTGGDSIQIFMAARNLRIEHGGRRDKAFLVESRDGGATFEFIAWIVPWTDQHRAVMPSAARAEDGSLVVTARRRNPLNETNWVDAFVSHDDGRSWSFLSRVGGTGAHNGNPPALVRLRDGRLACCYGNRDSEELLLRTSDDGGKTWGEPMVLRQSSTSDFGYPQLVQNHRGELVALYYLALETPEHAGTTPGESYIEAAILSP